MKKGLKTLIAGILLFVLGGFVVPTAFILFIILGGSDAQQFIVPGSIEVEASEPGRYYLWNDYRVVYEGKSYNRSEIIPDGAEIKVTDLEGQKYTFISNASMSSSSGSSSKKSIGYVELTSPAELNVSVSGSFEERVFSFSKSNIMKMFGLIYGCIGLSALLVVAGMGIAIWGIVKLASKGEAPVAA